MRLELCGIPGSGKTCVARSLSADGYAALFENYRTNPFWGTAGSSDQAVTFASDVGFLFQHASLLAGATNQAHKVVSDFSLLSDRAFARGRQAPMHFGLYDLAHQLVLSNCGFADAYVIFLPSIDTALRRVRERARIEEQGMTAAMQYKLQQTLLTEAREWETLHGCTVHLLGADDCERSTEEICALIDAMASAVLEPHEK